MADAPLFQKPDQAIVQLVPHHLENKPSERTVLAGDLEFASETDHVSADAMNSQATPDFDQSSADAGDEAPTPSPGLFRLSWPDALGRKVAVFGTVLGDDTGDWAEIRVFVDGEYQFTDEIDLGQYDPCFPPVVSLDELRRFWAAKEFENIRALYAPTERVQTDDDTAPEVTGAVGFEATEAQGSPTGDSGHPAGRRRDEPSKKAFKAYLSHKLGDLTQTEIAARMGTSQGQVSRWVRQVKQWLELGNQIPDETRQIIEPNRVLPMDPALIDSGPRQVSGTKARLQGQKQRDDHD
ncbi:MAG TPA: hypothetical protein VJZ71_20485 [Phycisphaerae bacterium]|nr:hypothetical protein [Phycisphaerae bacterium]